MGLSRQECWSRLQCPPLEDLPDPGILHVSVMSPALAGRFFTTITTWEALLMTTEGKGKVLVAHSCPTICNTMDCSPPGSSVHGMLQARILEWVAISYSRGSCQPRDWVRFSCMQADSLPSEPPQKQSLMHKRSTTTHLKPLSTPSNLVQSVLHGWNQGTYHGWHS